MTNTTTTSDAHWRRVIALLDGLITYVSPVFVPVGVLGNLLSVFIWFKNRHKHLASATYMCIIGLADATCSCTFVNIWLYTNALTLGSKTQKIAETSLGCQMFTFINACGIFLSSFTLGVYSFERSVIIWFPFLANRIGQKMRFVTVGVGFMINVFLMGTVFHVGELAALPRGQNVTFACWFKEDAHQLWIELMRFGWSHFDFTIPLVLITVSNIAILLGIRRSQGLAIKSTKSKNQIEMKFLINLLIISAFAKVTTRPNVIAYSLGSIVTEENGYRQQSVAILQTLSMKTGQFTIFNLFVNPIVMFCSLKFFRDEAGRIFCCGFRSHEVVRFGMTKSSIVSDS